MANYVKTEDGYKEIGFIADETVLASGVIAGVTAANKYTDTGLTLSDLKKWKVWGFRFYTDPLTSYKNLGIAINGLGGVKLYTYNIMSAAVIAGWFDNDKRTIHVIDSYFNDSNMEVSSPFIEYPSTLVLNDSNAVSGMSRCMMPSVQNLPGSTKVFFYNQDLVPAGNRILWEIRGLIK